MFDVRRICMSMYKCFTRIVRLLIPSDTAVRLKFPKPLHHTYRYSQWRLGTRKLPVCVCMEHRHLTLMLRTVRSRLFN